jgi:hypothetical protein
MSHPGVSPRECDGAYHGQCILLPFSPNRSLCLSSSQLLLLLLQHMATVNSTASSPPGGDVTPSGSLGSAAPAVTGVGLTMINAASGLLTDVFWAVSKSTSPPVQATTTPVHSSEQQSSPPSPDLEPGASESPHLPSGPPVLSSSVSVSPSKASDTELATTPPPASGPGNDPTTATSLVMPTGISLVDTVKSDQTAISLGSSSILAQDATKQANRTVPVVSETLPASSSWDPSLVATMTASGIPSLLGMSPTGVPNNPKKVVGTGTRDYSPVTGVQNSLSSIPDLSLYDFSCAAPL